VNNIFAAPVSDQEYVFCINRLLIELDL